MPDGFLMVFVSAEVFPALLADLAALEQGRVPSVSARRCFPTCPCPHHHHQQQHQHSPPFHSPSLCSAITSYFRSKANL